MLRSPFLLSELTCCIFQLFSRRLRSTDVSRFFSRFSNILQSRQYIQSDSNFSIVKLLKIFLSEMKLKTLRIHHFHYLLFFFTLSIFYLLYIALMIVPQINENLRLPGNDLWLTTGRRSRFNYLHH